MAASGDRLLADPLYLRLKEHVVESTGLTYYTDKDGDLAQRVRRRLAVVGAPDCAGYLDILRDPLRGPSELDLLIEEVTIGETYFFRHREHFDALRDLVFPNLIARNRANRRLRIWCAGCADGPEPYSLSILLKRDMGRLLTGWDVTILGTDINRRCLARAREGRFEAWALRATPEDLKRDCFRQEGNLWSLAPEYKEWVSFQYHNLVEQSVPSLLNNLFCFDLIVCRNVMIYFGSDLMQRMVRQFHGCLVPGAWLLVGPAEPNMTHFTSYRAVNAPGVTLYQKPDSQLPRSLHEMVWLDDIPPPIANRPACEVATIQKGPVENLPQVENLPHMPTLDEVRRQADQGAWESAAAICEQLLKTDSLSSAAHFYQGLVLEQMGRHDAAEKSLRRAIYLDRQSALAHYYLGLLLQSRRDARQAERCFENTVELLRPRNDGDVFGDADGISVAELRKLAQMQIDILRERV